MGKIRKNMRNFLVKEGNQSRRWLKAKDVHYYILFFVKLSKR